MSELDLRAQGLHRHPAHRFLIHSDGRRLGRHVRSSFERNARAFRFSRYLVPTALAAPPTAIDHASLVSVWPMNGNDRLGICGPAGAAHQDQSWSVNAGRPELRPAQSEIERFYFALTGGVDSGVYLEEMFASWRKNGLAGDKIEAYVEVDAGDLTQLKLAIQLFGSAGLGLSLPDRNTFGPWTSHTPKADYGTPNPNNGHYVCAVAYDDATKMVKVVTWGALEDMSYEFFQLYCDQSVVALNDLSLSPVSGQSPEAFDFATLQADLDHLKDPTTPPDDPPPPPSPEPPSGCLAVLVLSPLWMSGLRA